MSYYEIQDPNRPVEMCVEGIAGLDALAERLGVASEPPIPGFTRTTGKYRLLSIVNALLDRMDAALKTTPPTKE